MKAPTILRSVLTSLLVLSMCQVSLAGEAKGKDGQAGRLKVMTQNIYVGANLFKILNPDQPIPINAAEIFGDIQVTDFAQRAESIADLIAEHEPHLIGLQEVSLIRTQCPSDIIPPGDRRGCGFLPLRSPGQFLLLPLAPAVLTPPNMSIISSSFLDFIDICPRLVYDG